MATNTSKINLTDLDFDDIKTSLKEYLQDQTEFADFDFEGAGINILMDLLAYNTYYASFFANMLANEMFLDTAVKRDSVVSHAKTISYTPSSIRAARAIVDITVTPNDSQTPAAISIPRNTKFRTSVNNQAFTFVTIESTNVKRNADGDYIARGVELVEGVVVEFAYEADPDNSEQKFIVPNLNADTTTLKVRVRQSISNSETTTYNLTADTTLVDSTSNVYWLQEVEGGFFEVYFGDGVVGKKLAAGNIVILEYVLTNGESANGLGSATAPFAYFSGGATYNINNVSYTTTKLSVETISVASSGAEKESTNSIRFLAPKFYDSQNRAVTTQDYRTIITKKFPAIESIAVWGGEENDPVDLGKVYLSFKPYAGTEITAAVESSIISELKQLNVVTIEPVITDPDYTYLIVDTDVTYDATQTNKSGSDIETLVFNTIRNYGDNQLEKFARNFRISKLTTLIDNADFSIVGNLTTIQIKKKLEPIVAIDNDITINFNNKITSVSSSAFTYQGKTAYLNIDTATSKIRIYELINNAESYLNTNAGTVDVNTGVLSLVDFNISAYVGDTLDIIAVPVVEDIETERNQILIIDANDITVSSKQETVAV